MASQLVDLLKEATDEEVKTFVEENPDSVKQKDETTGRLPIHDALDWLADDEHGETRRKLASLEKIKTLLRAHPLCITEKDHSGQLPLHVVSAAARWKLSVFRFVLSSCPIAATVEDSEGNLPLDLAVVAGFDKKASVLIENCAEHGFDVTINPQSMLPLRRLAFRRGIPNEFTCLVFRKIPDVAKIPEPSNHSVLPLHEAVSRNAERGLVRLILNANPTALRYLDHEGRSPLHLAALGSTLSGVSLPLLSLLIDESPEMLSKADNFGFLPIHLTMFSYSIANEALEILYIAYPQGLSMVDCNGDSPLHSACSPLEKRAFSTRKIEWLVDKNCSLAQMINSDGNLPLHFAAENEHCPLCILKLLSEKFSRALEVQGKDGNLPLHFVVYHAHKSTAMEKVQFLLEKYPQAAKQKNSAGKLPLHIACEKRAPIEMIDLLIENHSEALVAYDDDGYLPFHHACLNTGKESAAIIDYLIKRLEGATLPQTESGVFPLLLASERDAPLNNIMVLARNSPELFSKRCTTRGAAKAWVSGQEAPEENPRKKQRLE